MKVLLPTDFSQNSITAIKYTFSALSSLKCDYILLNTYQSPQTGASMLVSMNEMLEKGSRDALAYLEDKFTKEHAGDIGSLTTVCDYGSVFRGWYPTLHQQTGHRPGCDGYERRNGASTLSTR